MFDLRETFFNISKGNVDPLASFTFILFVCKLLLRDIVFQRRFQEVPSSKTHPFWLHASEVC